MKGQIPRTVKFLLDVTTWIAIAFLFWTALKSPVDGAQTSTDASNQESAHRKT